MRRSCKAAAHAFSGGENKLEGLLLLLLLSWLFKAAKKKKGNRKKNLQSQLRSSVQKAIQAMENAQKPKMHQQPAVDAFAVDHRTSEGLAEGESHMQVTWDIHGHPSSTEEYMGSMAADTFEGEDACDPDLGHERFERNEEQSVYDGAIGSEPALNLNPRAIYQGFVMSEILKRPSERRGFRR